MTAPFPRLCMRPLSLSCNSSDIHLYPSSHASFCSVYPSPEHKVGGLWKVLKKEKKRKLSGYGHMILRLHLEHSGEKMLTDVFKLYLITNCIYVSLFRHTVVTQMWLPHAFQPVRRRMTPILQYC